MDYTPNQNRYQAMRYRKCGSSGLHLPSISLGLWHNFGDVDEFENYRKLIWEAFDSGITHFDLANNYGPPAGSAEKNFGKILTNDLGSYRDELLISTKAGYYMWPGPYGEWGSRKYLLASLNQSLKRMNIEYVDIFYSHRFDPNTPLEETMGALSHAVKSGKALYVGISNYPAKETREATKLLKDMGTPCLIHQPKYSMLNRWVEENLLDLLEENGVGCIAFSPLAQGLLTSKYINGIPENSRAHNPHGFLQESDVTPQLVKKITKLNEIALKRNQTLAQMAISWLLKDQRVTSVVVGASSTKQLAENLQSAQENPFSSQELSEIEKILES